MMRAAALALALLPPLATPAWAHPHGWIEIEVRVLFDASGRVTGLRQSWLFDEYYTAFVLGGSAAMLRNALQARLDAVTADNLAGLKGAGYFTHLEHGGAAVAHGEATEAVSELRGGRLAMSFLLPFAGPLALAGEPLTYALYDPTYYIELRHAEGPQAIVLENAPQGCTHALTEPNPSVEAMSLAASLDRTQSAGDTLGAVFAQHVFVECP